MQRFNAQSGGCLIQLAQNFWSWKSPSKSSSESESELVTCEYAKLGIVLHSLIKKRRPEETYTTEQLETRLVRVAAIAF